MSARLGTLSEGVRFEMDGQTYQLQEAVPGDPEDMVWALNLLTGRAYQLHPDFVVVPLPMEPADRIAAVRRMIADGASHLEAAGFLMRNGLDASAANLTARAVRMAMDPPESMKRMAERMGVDL